MGIKPKPIKCIQLQLSIPSLDPKRVPGFWEEFVLVGKLWDFPGLLGKKENLEGGGESQHRHPRTKPQCPRNSRNSSWDSGLESQTQSQSQSLESQSRNGIGERAPKGENQSQNSQISRQNPVLLYPTGSPGRGKPNLGSGNVLGCGNGMGMGEWEWKWEWDLEWNGIGIGNGIGNGSGVGWEWE